MSILTTCAACAKPIDHEAPAHCVNCQTRYCSDRCLRYHAHRGGHDDDCEEITKGGGAEQHHANKKYEEAVAVAVEECANDTEGQTCYICLEDGSEEGLVRMCACRGAAGFAHVSCLARQAVVAVERGITFDRWTLCGLCKQDYHGVVRCALGWACWKTYVGRPESDEARLWAMTELGNGLSNALRHADALSVREAEKSMLRRIGAPEEHMLGVQSNLAITYCMLGRLEEALRMRQEVYSGRLRLSGEEHVETLVAADNYADSLASLKRFEEAKALLRKTLPVARRVLGENNEDTLKMRSVYADALYFDPAATRDDLRESVETYEDAGQIARRVLGDAHPLTGWIEDGLQDAQDVLYARGLP